MPIINMIPPIVGVPCLFLCQVGPTSLIVWPNFSLCRNGIAHFPISAVTPNAIAAASAAHNPLIFDDTPSDYFSSFGHTP